MPGACTVHIALNDGRYAHLTDRQALVLAEIIKYIDAHGYPPTVRELMATLGFHGTNGVVAHLRALERKGVLVHSHYKSRSISLNVHTHSTRFTLNLPPNNNEYDPVLTKKDRSPYTTSTSESGERVLTSVTLDSGQRIVAVPVALKYSIGMSLS